MWVSSTQCAISLWFDNGVQEGDGPILLVVLYCKPSCRVNTIDVLEEALFVGFLVDDKGVIHKPAPEPRGVGGSTKSFLFKVLHVEIGHNGADWRTNGKYPQPVHRTGLGKKSRCS